METYEEIMKAKSYLPFKMGYLTEAVIAKAEEELGETEEARARTIPELRKLVEAEPEFSCPTNEEHLLMFLRPRKFDVQRSFTLLQNSYKVMKMYSDIYDMHDPEYLRNIFDQGIITVLPYRDQDGCAVFVLKMGKWDPNVCSISQFVTALTVTTLRAIDDPVTQVCGIQVLVDVKGLQLKHVRCMTPRFIYLISVALRNTIAARFRNIHIYNESKIVPYMWGVFKIFLSDKIKKRMHFHGDNPKQLHQFIPREILPSEEYGGENSQDISGWFKKEMEKFFDRYREVTMAGYKK